jgi:hypothetical protein
MARFEKIDGMYRIYTPRGIWVDTVTTERYASVLVDRMNTRKVI